MNLDNLNKWLTLFANLGVLAGILFLAIEIQQNTNMIQSQTRDSLTKNNFEFYSLILSSPENIDAMLDLGFQTPELGEQAFRFNIQAQAQFRLWENEWYQFESGLFEEDEMQARRSLWISALETNPGFRQIWANRSATYSESFRREIDNILEELED